MAATWGMLNIVPINLNILTIILKFDQIYFSHLRKRTFWRVCRKFLMLCWVNISADDIL